MIRRVFCLLLSCQLLLVQGLLCRGCPAPVGQHGHTAARPHIHARQLLPAQAPVEQESCPCQCSQQQPDGCPPDDPDHLSPRVCAALPPGADPDDVVSLPAALVAEEAQRSGPRADAHPAGDFSPPVVSDALRHPEPPRQDADPPPGYRPGTGPLYLLHLTLLI